MADSSADRDQKTEAPTGKRLDEAREHGQIPVSRETSALVALLGILTVTGWMLPGLIHHLADYLRGFLESPHEFRMDEANIQALFIHAFGRVAMLAGLCFAVLMAAAIAGAMLQTGFFFALDLLAPDLSRLLPSRGMARLFSLQSVADLVKSLGKLGFLGAVAYAVIRPTATMAPQMTGMPIDAIMLAVGHNVTHLITMLVLSFAIIAAGDLFFTRYQYIRNLRMTKQEVKDEFKQQEGDPMIKSRLRQMRAEKARKRMMAQVPKADVIVTNPTHYAVALKYEGGKMSAPVVVAKGINLIAERIREVATEHRVPLVSNPPLARALHDSVEVDQAIPTQYYRAVAEIISYVYKLRKRAL